MYGYKTSTDFIHHSGTMDTKLANMYNACVFLNIQNNMKNTRYENIYTSSWVNDIFRLSLIQNDNHTNETAMWCIHVIWYIACVGWNDGYMNNIAFTKTSVQTQHNDCELQDVEMTIMDTNL